MLQSCYRFILRMGAIFFGLATYLSVEAAVIGSLNLLAALLLAAASAFAAYRLFTLSGMMRKKQASHGNGPNGHKTARKIPLRVPVAAPKQMPQRPGRAA